MLIAADYSQVELRIPAYMSKDPNLLAAMCAPEGTREADVHAQNVERIFGVSYEDQQEEGFNQDLRTRAKNNMFGALYLSGGHDVVEVIEQQMLADDNFTGTIPTEKEIHDGIMTIRASYPVLFDEWIPSAIEQARERGGWVYTLYGRSRLVAELVGRDKYKRKEAERQVVSHIIQGTAADLMRFAIKVVDGYCLSGVGLWLLLSIHDELVVEDDNYQASHAVEIGDVMQLGQPLWPVPLLVDVKAGDTWGSMKKL